MRKDRATLPDDYDPEKLRTVTPEQEAERGRLNVANTAGAIRARVRATLAGGNGHGPVGSLDSPHGPAAPDAAA